MNVEKKNKVKNELMFHHPDLCVCWISPRLAVDWKSWNGKPVLCFLHFSGFHFIRRIVIVVAWCGVAFTLRLFKSLEDQVPTYTCRYVGMPKKRVNFLYTFSFLNFAQTPPYAWLNHLLPCKWNTIRLRGFANNPPLHHHTAIQLNELRGSK